MGRHSKSTLRHFVGRMPRNLKHPVAIGVWSVVGLALLLGPTVVGTPARGGATVTPASAAVNAVAAVTTPAKADAEPAGTAAQGYKSRSEAVGFYVNWDDSSYRSLNANIRNMTILMPEWYHLDNNGHVRQFDAKGQKRAMALVRAKKPGLKVMPIVNQFGSPNVTKLLKNGAARRRMAFEIVRMAKNNHFAGVNIDFEGLPASSRGDLVAFMNTLAPLAHRYHLQVSQDVIVGSPTYNHRALARNADFLVPMMYDEHWKSSGAGPIASHGWYTKTLKKFFAQVPPRKVVIALGAYAYDWGRGARADSMTHGEAVWKARATKQTIKLDKRSLNPTFAYSGHRVWMLDPVVTFNQVKTASRYQPRGYALWRLGAEDGGTWKVLANRDKLDGYTARGLHTAKRSVAYDPKRGLIVAEYVTP